MIYLDSSIIIRMLEGNDRVRLPIERKLAALNVTERVLVTSRLSTLECRSKPLRDNDTDLLELFDRFFRAGEVLVQEIDSDVIDKATELRAFVGLKTPDAIHVATFMLLNAKSFWSTDTRIKRCPGIAVELFPAV
jgi:predicted nucleic acid-binding protein